ncbi:uncharacterized protein LOC125554398 [Triticum urartu]|uniref:uncharacterized protein LOC125554396 n=1 Tax=Triticum urartu TaxID=4572 RepID=UPI0020435BD8|nr:uncharacterized protein LOC125554396 [Triticum urartu]XP_048573922.1 uncharacterized protein LOC125554398 [Triticum urartu]
MYTTSGDDFFSKNEEDCRSTDDKTPRVRAKNTTSSFTSNSLIRQREDFGWQGDRGQIAGIRPTMGNLCDDLLSAIEARNERQDLFGGRIDCGGMVDLGGVRFSR